jgi:succinoglycan biosynthesis transport protein ExoP
MSRSADVLQGAGGGETLARDLNPPGRHGNDVFVGPNVVVIARDEAMKLTERLFLSTGTEKAPQAVIFSSVDPGEESSRICALVGEALAARVSGSVCLVDANLYSPSLHRQFDVENCGGLGEMIGTKGAVRGFARQLPAGNLWLVTRGKLHAEPHTLLASIGIRERLAELRNEFDYVLIEASAVSINGTATWLGPLADGVVLIVEANSTRREVARKAKESLERAGVRLLGAVLNNRTFPIPDVIYRSI